MNEKKPTNPWTKSLFIWMGILLLLVFFVQSIGGSREAPGTAMAYSEFVKQVDEGNVKSIAVAATPTGNSNITGVLNDGKTFKTVAPEGCQRVRAGDRQGRFGPGQGRGTVEHLADPAATSLCPSS